MIDLTDFGLSPALLQRLRQARTVPAGGIWYWYPTPQGWDLAAFNASGPLTPASAPDERANVFHVQEFEEVVDLMARAWQIVSLPLTRDTYQGIPRGRVSKGPEGSWKLEHGGEFATRHIKQLFGLNGEQVQASVIEHEMTDLRHVQVVEQTLLYKTDDDSRIMRAFKQVRDHRAVASTVSSPSVNARVSMAIATRHGNGGQTGRP